MYKRGILTSRSVVGTWARKLGVMGLDTNIRAQAQLEAPPCLVLVTRRSIQKGIKSADYHLILICVELWNPTSSADYLDF